MKNLYQAPLAKLWRLFIATGLALAGLTAHAQVTTLVVNNSSAVFATLGPQTSIQNFYREANIYPTGPISGLSAGDQLTGLEIFHGNAASAASGVGNGGTVPRFQIPMRIKLLSSALTTLAGVQYSTLSAATTVYTGFLPIMEKDQTIRIPFQTPFTYTANTSLIVIFELDNPASATLNDYPRGRIQAGGGATGEHAYWQGATAPGATAPTATNTSKLALNLLKSPAALPDCSPDLLYPSDGETSLCPSTGVRLRWQAPVPPAGFGLASSYKVYLGTNPGADNVLNGTSTVNPYFTTAALTPNTTYNWYIVPTNATGDAVGCSSVIHSFTTGPNTVPGSTATFTDNMDGCSGWVAVNSLSNRWVQGTAQRMGSSGSAYYISLDDGLTANYVDSLTASTTATPRSSLIRTVTFPASQPSLSINFDYIAGGDGDLNGADVLKVFLAPTTAVFTPNITTANINTILASGGILLGTLEEQYTWASASLPIPAAYAGSCAGGTRQLVFMWEASGNSAMIGTSAAIDNIQVSASASAYSFPGTFTVNPLLPASSSNFQSLSAAINALNGACSPAGTIFQLPSGAVYNEASQLPPIAVSGTSGSPIQFVKTGTGANPVLKPNGTAGATTDYGIRLTGADYISFDGLDIDATLADEAVEFGYQLNAFGTDGSSNNTIKNASISLSLVPLTTGAAVSQTTNAGAPQTGNTYESIKVSYTYNGIIVTGLSANPETGNRVLKCRVGSSVSGNMYGTRGIGLDFQGDFVVSKDTVQNFSGSSAIDGIGVVSQTSGIGEISNNIVRSLVTSSTATTSGISHTFVSTAANSIARIFNNQISDIVLTVPSGSPTTTRHAEGITTGSSGANTCLYEVDFNSVRLEGTSANNSSAAISFAKTAAATGPLVRMRNNNLTNFSVANAGTAFHTVVYMSGNFMATTASTNYFNWNNYYVANTTQGYVGRVSTTNYATLINFRAAQTAGKGKDSVSVSVIPIFAGNTNLKAGSSSIDDEGRFVTYGTVASTYYPVATYSPASADFEGETRTVATSIGADQFTARDVDMTVSAILTPIAKTYGCYSTTETVSVQIRNLAGNTPNIDFSIPANNTDVVLTITPPSGPSQTYTETISSGILNSGATQNVTFPTAINMNAVGNYTIEAHTVVSGDPDPDAVNSSSVVRTRIASNSLPQVMKFNGFTGSNLHTITASRYKESQGTTEPLGTTSNWTSSATLWGSTAAYISAGVVSTNGHWILLPKVTANPDLRLRFKAAVSTSTTTKTMPGTLTGDVTDETFQVRVSTDCGLTWSSTPYSVSPLATGGFTNEMQEREVNLGGTYPSGTEILVAFYYFNTNVSGTYYLFLDDISLSNVPSTSDVSPTLVSPGTGGSCYGPTQGISVKLTNFYGTAYSLATKPVTIKVVATGPAGGTFTQTVNSGTIAGNGSTTITLPGTLNMTTSGTYTFRTTISGDDFAFNDSVTSTVSVQARFASLRSLPLFAGFTGYTGVVTTLENATNSYFWETNSYPITASVAVPTSSWTSSSEFSTTTAKYPYNSTLGTGYLVSPKFVATANTRLEFKAALTYASSATYPAYGMDRDDSLKIMVSTDCGATFATIDYLDSVRTRSTDKLGNFLRNYSISLGSYAANTDGIMIAFKATNGSYTAHSGTNSFDVHLDDIRVYDAPAQDLLIERVIEPNDACVSGTSQGVSVRIRNVGTGSWNFAANPVNFSVGVSQANADWEQSSVLAGAAYQTLTGTLNTGTLAPNSTQTFALPGTVTLTVPEISNIPNAQDVTDENTEGLHFAASMTSANDQGTLNNNGYAPTYSRVIATSSIENIFFGYNASTTIKINTSAGGWREARGVYPGTPVNDTASWNMADWNNDANSANDRAARFFMNSNRRHGWLISPTFKATAFTAVSYDAFITTPGVVSGGGQMGSDDRLYILVSSDCGATWSTIGFHSRTQNKVRSNPDSNQHFVVNVPGSYNGQDIQIAFMATEGAVDDADNIALFLDNILINNRFPDNVSILEIQEPNGVTCKTGTPVRVFVKNNGANTITSFTGTATFRQAGQPDVVVGPTTFTTPLASNASASIIIGSAVLPNLNPWTVEVVLTLAGDGDLTDNTASTTTNVFSNPSATLNLTPGSGCSGTSITLLSSSATTEWYGSLTNYDLLGSGATFNTPVITSTTPYYASVRQTDPTVRTGGKAALVSAGSSSSVGIGIQFQIKRAIQLQSVNIQATGAATFIIRITDGQNNNTGADITFVSPGAGSQVVPVNRLLQPGTYRIVKVTTAGTLTYEEPAFASGDIVSADGNFIVNRGLFSFDDRLEPARNYGFFNFKYQVVGCPSTPRKSVTATVLPNGTWRGVNTNGWTDAANWCGGVPTAVTDVIIPASANNPQIISGIQNANNVTIQTGAQLTLNGTLNMAGSLSSVNPTVAGTGTLRLNGSSPQTISSNLTVGNMTIANSSGVSIAAGKKVSIEPRAANGGRLELEASSSITTTGADLVLMSNATGTAYLAPVPASATFTGQLTQERYVANTTPTWHFVGSPVQSSTFAQLTDDIRLRGPFPWATIADPDSNHTHIFEHRENQYRNPVPGVTNVQLYGWYVPGSNAMPTGEGFRIWIGSDFFASVSQQRKFEFKGTPNIATSPLSFSLSYNPSTGYDGGGWNLVSNPLPSALDWDAATGWSRNAALDNAFYVYRTNAYYAYVDGTPTVPIANPSWIPSSQGFFVKAHAASPAMSITESAKVSSGGLFMRTAAQTDLMRVALANASGDVDYAVIHFRQGATKGFDPNYDAFKLPGSVLNVSSFGAGRVNLSINKRPPLAALDSIPMNVEVPAAGQYTFTFTELESMASGTTLYLLDNFNHTTRMIAPGMVYTFTVTPDISSQGSGRFVIVADPGAVTDIREDLTPEVFSLYPNPVSSNGQLTAVIEGISGIGGNRMIALQIFDATGKMVAVEEFRQGDIAATGEYKLKQVLGRGIYTVRLSGGSKVFTRKLVVE